MTYAVIDAGQTPVKAPLSICFFHVQLLCISFCNYFNIEIVNEYYHIAKNEEAIFLNATGMLILW